MCAAFSDGQATCWGGSRDGQLGIDSSSQVEQVDTPNDILQLQLPSGSLMLNGFHSHTGFVNCAVVQGSGATTLPSLRCWGSSQNGILPVGQASLSFGTSVSSPGRTQDSPTLDFGSLPAEWAVRQAVTHDKHACTLLRPVPLSSSAYNASENGAIVPCWGENRGCALGVTDVSSAVAIDDGTSLSLAEWPNTIEYTYNISVETATTTRASSGSGSPSSSPTDWHHHAKQQRQRQPLVLAHWHHHAKQQRQRQPLVLAH